MFPTENVIIKYLEHCSVLQNSLKSDSRSYKSRLSYNVRLPIFDENNLMNTILPNE